MYRKIPQHHFSTALCAIALLLTVGILQFNAVGCAASTQTAEPVTFRVMTFNIHHGEGSDGRIDVGRIAQLIEAQHADIVAIQEVDRGTKRVQKRDILVELSEAAGMAYAFGKTIDFQGGMYGLGILTRFPILAEHQTLFAESSAGEQRGLLRVTLSLKGTEVVVMNTHLDDKRAAERETAARTIVGLCDEFQSGPVILCGDLNTVPGTSPLAILSSSLTDVWEQLGGIHEKTFPSGDPEETIDYIFISPHVGLRPVSQHAVPTSASDHRPVVAEFVLQR
jgi:endonuclease/exonuclease/phosphatase family metal-dependent hydrolase